jgi:hypothetical protein
MNSSDPPPNADYLHFQMLMRASANPASIKRLQPKDMEELSSQISKALERCCVPEKSITDQEREINDMMLGSIIRIGQFLARRDDDMDETLLNSFRKSITTSDNLQALLRMLDANVRTGAVRCKAVYILWQLLTTSTHPIWDIPMKDGSDFSSQLLSAFSQALDDRVTKEKDTPTCQYCGGECLRSVYSLIPDALHNIKPPTEIFTRISKYNWTLILQNPEFADANNKNALELFVPLHSLAVFSLRENSDNENVKVMLRKMGGCHELFTYNQSNLRNWGLRMLQIMLNGFPCFSWHFSTAWRLFRTTARRMT